MSKNIIQDVVTRSVPIHRVIEDRMEALTERHYEPRHHYKKRNWKPALFVAGGTVVVLVTFLILSSFLSRVLIKVSTTKSTVKLQELVFFNKDGTGGGIRYDIMRFKDTEFASVPVTGTKVVQKYATGRVTIYNAYGSAPQPLVVGTRLETKDGKIYKIEKAVTVPGLTISGGKIVPGSAEVSVKASQSGAEYNISASDFTIPGFKSGPKYQKIYAKSIGAIAGGFNGEIKTASPSDLLKARSKAQEALKQRLTKDALVQVPGGMILYQDAMFISYTDNAVDDSALTGSGVGQMNLQVTGVLNAILVDNAELMNFIISKKVDNVDKDSSIVIADLDKINFQIINRDKVSLDGTSSIMVKLSGDVVIIWDFDENALKNKLIGIKKSAYPEIFKEFPVIEKAEAEFVPSWALYFPGDPSRIVIDKGF